MRYTKTTVILLISKALVITISTYITIVYICLFSQDDGPKHSMYSI